MFVKRARQEWPRLDDPCIDDLLDDASCIGDKDDLGAGPHSRAAGCRQDRDCRIPHIKLRKFRPDPAPRSGSSELGESLSKLHGLMWGTREPDIPRLGGLRGGGHIVDLFASGWVARRAIKRGDEKGRP